MASISVALAPLRRRPSHDSECVTQALHGETFEILEDSPDGLWWRVRLAIDRYEGWIRSWYGTRAGGRFPVTSWVRPRGAMVRALPKRGAAVLAELPWPARLALLGQEKGWAAVRLEDGRDGFVASREVVTGSVPGGPATGARLAKTAGALVGAPYLWGGRSAWGFDCSGYAQAVFTWHGVALPRDSQEQWEAGSRAGGGRLGRAGADRAGDLLFFGPDPSRVSHVGISAGNGDFLHAYGEVCHGSLDERSQSFVPELVTIFLGAVPWTRFRGPKDPGSQ